MSPIKDFSKEEIENIVKLISFTKTSSEEYEKYIKNNKILRNKFFSLIVSIDKNAYEGEGHPEPLKGNLTSFYSRRIDDKHRLIYKVDTIESEKHIVILHSFLDYHKGK